MVCCKHSIRSFNHLGRGSSMSCGHALHSIHYILRALPLPFSPLKESILRHNKCFLSIMIICFSLTSQQTIHVRVPILFGQAFASVLFPCFPELPVAFPSCPLRVPPVGLVLSASSCNFDRAIASSNVGIRSPCFVANPSLLILISLPRCADLTSFSSLS